MKKELKLPHIPDEIAKKCLTDFEYQIYQILLKLEQHGKDDKK